MKMVLLFLLAVMPAVAELSIQEMPVSVIEGKESQLNRPEGVAFSPVGDFLAVANSDGNSILIYKCVGSQCETTPCTVISGPKSKLEYPHDVAFSPYGSHLAVANRDGNKVTIYKKDPETNTYKIEPIAVIVGSGKTHFNGIGAVAYSPVHNLLALANTYGNNVFLYCFQEDDYETKPHCTLSSSSLDVPDGLAFSPDGKYLAVTCHGNHTVPLFTRSKHSVYQFNQEPTRIIQGENTLLKYPHSVSFHPSGKFLVISSAGGKASINLFQRDAKTNAISLLPIQTLETYNPKAHPEECGAKGIAISSDGKALAVCKPDIKEEDKVFLYKLF